MYNLEGIGGGEFTCVDIWFNRPRTPQTHTNSIRLANDTVNSSTHLLQYAVRLLVDDLAAPGTVLQLLIATGCSCLFVAVHDAFVRFLREGTEHLPLNAIDGRLGLALHAGIEGVGLRLQCWACHRCCCCCWFVNLPSSVVSSAVRCVGGYH